MLSSYKNCSVSGGKELLPFWQCLLYSLLFNLWQSDLSILALISWAIRVLLLKSFLMSISFSYFEKVPCYASKVPAMLAQANLELAVLMPQPSECWDYRQAPSHLTPMPVSWRFLSVIRNLRSFIKVFDPLSFISIKGES
jgi:hypothetical protein